MDKQQKTIKQTNSIAENPNKRNTEITVTTVTFLSKLRLFVKTTSTSNNNKIIAHFINQHFSLATKQAQR